MQTRPHSPQLGMILISLFTFLFVFFIYTFLHEAGHTVMGLLFGQSLTEFDVSFWDLSAHVGLSGRELTSSQLAVRALAGGSLPLLIWALFMSFVPRKANFTLEVLKLLSSMFVLSTLLVWIVIPVLYIFGKALPSDDVTHFLRHSQVQPLLLAVTALIVYVRGWAFFLSKIDGLRNEFLLFRTTDHETITAGTRTTIPVLSGILAFCVVLTVTLNSSAARNTLDRFSPPQDFAPVAGIDLSARAYAAETLAQFSLDESGYVGVFVEVRGINTTFFDLSMIGPEGYSSIVLHGEGYNAVQDGGLWEEKLLPGTYQLVLTSHQSPGTAAVFLKTH